MSDREYLIQAAAWQESLLQAYRSLHVTIQSILLAIGIGLTAIPFASSAYPSLSPSGIACAVLLTAVAGLHFFSNRKLSGVVRARGEDINWWHAELIRCERGLSVEARYFTQFKVHQQRRRIDANAETVSNLEIVFLSANNGMPLTEQHIEQLIGKGLGHTRKVVDQQIFFWISCIWWLLLIWASGGLLAAVLYR